MIGKALTVASVLATTQAQYQYVATFGGDNDITGTVTIDRGSVSVDLDLSAMPDLPDDFETCTDGGLSYHIHELWNYNDTITESMACGADVTGGHWDPWNACGGASGNPYCYSGDTPGANQCIPKSAYSVDFPAMPFSAEVGDWSSKYGKLELDNSTMKIERVDSSYWEVLPEEMDGFSIVFHCNGGARAFCALFEENDVEAAATVPAAGAGVNARAIFSELMINSLLPSEVTLFADGTVSGFLGDADGVFTDAATDGCASFEYGIFEAGSVTLTEGAIGGDCENAVGAFYDPTHQCPSFSGSQYCTDGKLCDDADYEYACDFDSDRYTCAPGDLSGKFGSFDPTADTLTVTYDDTDALLPLASDLVGKVMAIYCPEDIQNDLTVFACAPINTYDAATPAPTNGASRAFGVGAALVAVVAAMW